MYSCIIIIIFSFKLVRFNVIVKSFPRIPFFSNFRRDGKKKKRNSRKLGKVILSRNKKRGITFFFFIFLPIFSEVCKKLPSSFLQLVLLVILTTMTCNGGIIPLGHGGDDGSLHHALTQSHATSFVHFHGPVEGPVFEVKVPHIPQHEEYGQIHGQHHHEDKEEYTVDYVAQPKYEFSYGVEDHHTGDFHGQKESRDGKFEKLNTKFFLTRTQL